jgi:hypothetical protein
MPFRANFYQLPKAGYLSRLLLFTTPIALACMVSQMSVSYSQEAVGDEINLSCAVDGDGIAAVQARPAAENAPDYYDTSWLPSRSEFQMVADKQPSERVWNPLAKSWLTPEQIDLLGMAYSIGYQDGGASQARLVQGVLLQETIAGLLGRIGHLSAPIGKRSYGVMQVKVVAARDVLRRHPELGTFHTDDQLIARLMTDDEFNIRIASAYLKFLRRYKHNDQQALVAYNIGMGAARRVLDAADFKYVKKVERYLAVLVPRYNNKFPDGEAMHLASM